MERSEVAAESITAAEGEERVRFSLDEFLQKKKVKGVQQQQKLEVDCGNWDKVRPQSIKQTRKHNLRQDCLLALKDKLPEEDEKLVNKL